MTNLADILKSEISRLARRGLRAETDKLKKTVSAQRAELAALRRQVAELEKAHKALARLVDKGLNAKSRAPAGAVSNKGGQGREEGASGVPLRFRAAGVAANRKRLGLSAADFGLLIGASAASVRAWEEGKSKPSRSDLVAISAVRGICRREAQERLMACRAPA